MINSGIASLSTNNEVHRMAQEQILEVGHIGTFLDFESSQEGQQGHLRKSFMQWGQLYQLIKELNCMIQIIWESGMKQHELI